MGMAAKRDGGWGECSVQKVLQTHQQVGGKLHGGAQRNMHRA